MRRRSQPDDPRPGRVGSDPEAGRRAGDSRGSPLHAVRAGIACLWFLVLAFAALLESNPVVLGALGTAVLLAAAAARVGRGLRAALATGLGLAVVIALVNALVTRDGLTVIARLGELPILGHTDVTLEATVYGGVLGLRALTLILLGALYTLAVDPDGVLRLFRRISFRSALSATIATRMVPVLLRDGRRLADAQRCRPGPPPSRAALLRAGTANVLDRALDVAAALEVRGYGGARRPPRAHLPYSRHDLAFAASAAALAAVALVARVAGWAAFRAYPSLHAPAGPRELAVALALGACALAPFAQRRGVSPA